MRMALGKGLNALIGSSIAQKEMDSTIENVGAKVSKTSVRDEGIHGSLMIPISQIHADPQQPRKKFDKEELQDLVQSIQKHGILQPLIVHEVDDGSYEIIAGERRFRAAQMIGMTTVPCMVKPVDAKQKLEISLVENIQRKNLNAIEEAFAYQRLINEFGLTQEDIAKQVGKSRPYIANTVRLMDLPQDIQKGLIEEKITHTKARALLGLSTMREQLKAYYDIVEHADTPITTRATEEMVRAKKNKNVRDPMLVSVENRLREILGTKVFVARSRGRGTISIDFYSDEDLRKIVAHITKK